MTTENIAVVSRATQTTVDFAVTAAYSGNGTAVNYSTASVSAKLTNLSPADDALFKIDDGAWQPLKARQSEEFTINFATQTLTMKLGERNDGSASIRLVADGVPSGLYAGDTELPSVSAEGLAAIGVYPHQPIATKTTNYTAVVGDRIIFVDATSGNVTITLPAANASGAGYSQSLRVKRIDSSANTVTVQRAGADTIDGLTNTTIPALQSKDLNSNGISLWGVC